MPASAGDRRQIASGATAVVFMWVSVDGALPVPAKLRHRVFTADSEVNGALIGTHYTELRVLGPPVQGANWLLVSDGPGNEQDNHHRRGVFVVDGHAMTSRRYAIDWMQSVDGALLSGDPLDNRSYYVYRKSVLAVADAAVAEAKDFPDRPSGPPLRAPEQGQVAQDPGYSPLHHRANLRNCFREICPDRVRTAPLAVARRPGDARCPAARVVFLDEPDLCAGSD